MRLGWNGEASSVLLDVARGSWWIYRRDHEALRQEYGGELLHTSRSGETGMGWLPDVPHLVEVGGWAGRQQVDAPPLAHPWEGVHIWLPTSREGLDPSRPMVAVMEPKSRVVMTRCLDLQQAFSLLERDDLRQVRIPACRQGRQISAVEFYVYGRGADALRFLRAAGWRRDDPHREFARQVDLQKSPDRGAHTHLGLEWVPGGEQPGDPSGWYLRVGPYVRPVDPGDLIHQIPEGRWTKWPARFGWPQWWVHRQGPYLRFRRRGNGQGVFVEWAVSQELLLKEFRKAEEGTPFTPGEWAVVSITRGWEPISAPAI